MRNFTYTYNKSAAFPAPIFTKLTNTQQNYVKISYTESQTTGTINLKNM
jgi:hypothetical protein